MTAAKNFSMILALAAVLFAGACAGPGDERWPTVSFGPEIEKMEADQAAPGEVKLAPLPSLSDEEKQGLENQAGYLASIEQDFGDVARRLKERHQDYANAVNGIMKKHGDEFRDAWLTAEMELSNMSQLTESLARLRARINALGEPLPESARVLQTRAEALELQYRLFVKNQKAQLFQVEPTGGSTPIG